MVNHKIYHLNANEEILISLTSKLLTTIDGFTLEWNPNHLPFYQVEVNISIYLSIYDFKLQQLKSQLKPHHTLYIIIKFTFRGCYSISKKM